MTHVLKSPFFRYGSLILAAVTLITLMFPGFARNLLSTGPFMPHATCYLRDPAIIGLHVSTDLAIGLAYVSIAITLGYLVMKASHDIPFHWIFLAFGIFIISCGFTHFMEVWTVWESRYWLAGYVKLITAVASITTAIALFPLVPRVFRLISEVKAAAERREQLVVAHSRLELAHDELSRRKNELEQLNRDLEMFAYSAAHDLRGPARGIAGLCAVLREDYGSALPPDAQELIGRLIQSSKNMNQLLSDLLEYTRVSREEVNLSPVPVDTVVAQALESLQSEIVRQNASVSKDGRGESVLASPTLLLQIVANLIDNAIKYVPRGTQPRVVIRTERLEGNVVRLSVEDNGIGIEPQLHDRVFGLFTRLHHSREYPGTGLGLAIVQRAAERMHGRVGVASEPGKGSRFWVELKAGE